MTARIEKDLLCCYSGYFSDVFDALLGVSDLRLGVIMHPNGNIRTAQSTFGLSW